ncbi:MAG TPA: nitroreductase family protein [Longimicrobiales bacterium]|nr:nitroreductase family protein [Longimicrobiales bacterium]
MAISRSAHGLHPLASARFPREGSEADRLRFLLRYALAAPSSHNSQPWLFRLGEGEVELRADLTRWLRVADSDQRELYLSLGCALENLLIAAEHFGYSHEVTLRPDDALPTFAARVGLRAASGGRSAHRPLELFEAIAERHTAAVHFDGRPVEGVELARLQALVVEDDIRLVTTKDDGLRRAVRDLVVQSDQMRYPRPEYRHELASWVRDGSLGAPWGLRWAAGLAISELDLTGPMARKDAGRMDSAGALALVTSAGDDPRSQLRAGQVLERMWLMATHRGLAVQPMSGPLEVPQLRQELGLVFGTEEGVPQHLFRLGYAAGSARRRPRRDVEEVVEEA